MNIYDTFAAPEFIDAPKEFPLGDGAYITMLPTSGEKSKRAFQKMLEPYAPRLKAGGELTVDEANELNVRHFAETIVIGWRGLKGKDKEEIVWSKENAKLLFSDKKLAKFFTIIAKMADNDAAFAEAQAVEDEGNS